MICKVCGNNIEQGKERCDVCGWIAIEDYEENPGERMRIKKSHLVLAGILATVITAMVLVVSVILFFYFFTPEKNLDFPEETATETVAEEETQSIGVYYVYNCKEFVNLRAEASTKAEIIMEVPLGAEVECLEKDGDFYKVEYNRETGYILASYLTKEMPEEKEELDTSFKGTYYVYKCNEYVNLRSEASAESKSLKKVKLGEEVECLGKASSKFYKVKYDGVEGYINSAYLTHDKPVPTSTPEAVKGVKQISKRVNSFKKHIDKKKEEVLSEYEDYEYADGFDAMEFYNVNDEYGLIFNAADGLFMGIDSKLDYIFAEMDNLCRDGIIGCEDMGKYLGVTVEIVTKSREDLDSFVLPRLEFDYNDVHFYVRCDENGDVEFYKTGCSMLY